jgi:hypothetical protein
MKDSDNDIKDYQTCGWPDLEATTDGHCPCCDKPFSEEMRPEITGKCHTGPTFTSYYDGWLYFDCGTCRKPVCKIPVDRRLI